MKFSAWNCKINLKIKGKAPKFVNVLRFRLDEAEIEQRVAQLRKELNTRGPLAHDVKSLKPHQVHDIAAAKEKEMEKVRKAFGIREDYAEGDAFKQMRERKERESAAE